MHWQAKRQLAAAFSASRRTIHDDRREIITQRRANDVAFNELYPVSYTHLTLPTNREV